MGRGGAGPGDTRSQTCRRLPLADRCAAYRLAGVDRAHHAERADQQDKSSQRSHGGPNDKVKADIR